jgi:hypothetical protein
MTWMMSMDGWIHIPMMKNAEEESLRSSAEPTENGRQFWKSDDIFMVQNQFLRVQKF